MRRLHEDADLSRRFREAELLFLDCDGVIFDSNQFKLDAMRHALAGRSERELADMAAYWRNNGGVSRFVKFRHFFEQIAHTEDVDRAVDAACQAFGEQCLAAYATRRPVPEALATARAKGRDRTYVVSGASQTELEVVFRAQGIAQHFAAVLGSPRTKHTLIAQVLKERDTAAERTLFVGDGAGDFRVAQSLGLPFVYLDQFSEWTGARATLDPAPGVTWADDWPELSAAFGVSVTPTAPH